LPVEVQIDGARLEGMGLIRVPSILFFERHGPETLSSGNVVELHEKELAALAAPPLSADKGS
jgi:hypothetical protein